jgi:hypothetical protein
LCISEALFSKRKVKNEAASWSMEKDEKYGWMRMIDHSAALF